MAGWLAQSTRINYELRVLPILRTTLLGSVVATLALLAGFAAREPARPHVARVAAPARGPLIEAAEHPEWKQFLVLAAYRRADELERLRDLPVTPMIVIEEAAPATDAVPDPAPAVAALTPKVDAESEEITGAIEEQPSGIAMPMELGEASTTELPLSDKELIPPTRQPESLKRQNQSERKPPAKRAARLKSKPPAKPPAEPDLLTRIFGSRPAQ
jgi:hypothetical protein